MSTLATDYEPIGIRLGSFSGGPEAATLALLTLNAFQPLATQSGTDAALDDLHALQSEAAAGEHDAMLDDATLELGKRFLLALPKSLPVPSLGLDRDGELRFDWTAPLRRMLSVSLRSDGRVAYAVRLGARRATHGVEVFDDAIPEKIVRAVRELQQ
ncbi:MAG: hypothetical protein C4535_14435 [Comamonadaceae bacterium]|nr:MAG: hypothetical protein C4535_14435 [Comamonadaceae bacterium]